MQITIQIDCDTIQEFHNHLTKLATQVKRSAKKQKLNLLKDEFQKEDADSLSDNNCYGTHSVIIVPES